MHQIARTYGSIVSAGDTRTVARALVMRLQFHIFAASAGVYILVSHYHIDLVWERMARAEFAYAHRTMMPAGRGRDCSLGSRQHVSGMAAARTRFLKGSDICKMQNGVLQAVMKQEAA